MRVRIRQPNRRLTTVCVFVLLVGVSFALHAQESTKAKAEAPPNHEAMSGGLGGHYFVPRPLKEKYDVLIEQVRGLEAEIAKGELSSRDAEREIERLRAELKAVRNEVEEQKKFVAAAKVHTQSETTTFDLGKERMLLIVADKVRIVGWAGPNVKCVLEKSILGTADAPGEDAFKAIHVVHRNGYAPELVGKPAAELQAEEQVFLGSAGGQKLSPEGLAFRRKITEDNIAHHAIFSPMQGKQIDLIKIEGLSHDQGNRQISLEVSSPGGSGIHSSQWQRHALLTVYVPASEMVALKGGLGGLQIDGLNANLVVRGDGNRDYHANFGIKDLTGNLTADNIPLQAIENTRGNIAVSLTAYRGNSGTHHAEGVRTSYVELPDLYEYKNIRGDVQANFVRAQLRLSNVTGRIDVRNEYGDTVLVAEGDMSGAAHRIISHSGHIEVQFPDNTMGKAPLLALTECGIVRVDSDDRRLDTVNFETHSPESRERRGWMGFYTQKERDPTLFMPEYFDRVWQAVKGEDRTPGFDIISRGGSIRITERK